MNIAFFLTPKADVAWVPSTSTMRQAIERMEYHRYTAIPVLAPDGSYDSTLTEGDILWFMKQHPEVRFWDTEHVPLADVTRRMELRPVDIEANIEALLSLTIASEFRPCNRQVARLSSALSDVSSVLVFLRDRMSVELRSGAGS